MPQIPFALQWTITNDQIIALKDSKDGYLMSSSVSMYPGITYHLRIYPNGNSEEYRRQTWAFLQLSFGCDKKISADYTVTVESANYSLTKNQIFEESFGRGNFNCRSEELFDPEKKFIVDGKFTFKIDGVFNVENSQKSAFNEFQQEWDGGELGDQLWQNNVRKDFTIIADGKEIKVHKLVLESRSDVFAAMFDSNMKEAIENKVEISDFSFEVVETAIKIIYECNFITSFSANELMSLLQFFDKYNLPTAKDRTQDYLIDQISSATVCRLATCSIRTNSPKLKEQCIEFLMICLFETKTPLPDIDILDKDLALKLIKDSRYRIVETV